MPYPTSSAQYDVDMPATVLPNARYRARLRRVLRLLRHNEVVDACNMLEDLKEDAEQFRIFVRSAAYRPFLRAVRTHEQYLLASIKDCQAKLVVLGLMRADLQPEKRPESSKSRLGSDGLKRSSRRTPSKRG